MTETDILSSVFRIVPDVIDALRAGTSEEQIRKTLRENRAQMDEAFDAAAERIDKPRESE